MKKFLAAILFTLLPASALALPPVIGAPMSPYHTTVCDNAAEVKIIFMAAQQSMDVGIEAFRHLNTTKNEQGEPICVDAQATGIVTSVEELGDFARDDGRKIHTWAVSVEAITRDGRKIEGAYMWMEDASSVNPQPGIANLPGQPEAKGQAI